MNAANAGYGISVEASDVTIDGFTVINTVYGIGHQRPGAATIERHNTVVQNNIVRDLIPDNGPAHPNGTVRGIDLNFAADYASVDPGTGMADSKSIVQGNLIDNSTGTAPQVTAIVIGRDNTNPADPQGILRARADILDNCIIDVSGGVWGVMREAVIAGNTISGYDGAGRTFNGASPFGGNLITGGGIGPILSHSTIRDNVIRGYDAAAVTGTGPTDWVLFTAIQLYAPTDAMGNPSLTGAVAGGATATVVCEQVVIEANTIEDCLVGVHVSSQALDGITIGDFAMPSTRGNTFDGCDDAVLVHGRATVVGNQTSVGVSGRSPLRGVVADGLFAASGLPAYADHGAALVQNNDLRGHAESGALAKNQGRLDAGTCDTATSLSGLATGAGAMGGSSGANLLTGYLGGMTGPFAVRNDNPAQVATAHANDFGAPADLESLLYDDSDAMGVSAIEASGIAALALLCPAGTTVEEGAGLPVAATTLEGFRALGGSANATAGTLSSSEAGSGTCNYTITRTYTLVDACGRMTTCTQDFMVVDTTAPVITLSEGTTVTITCQDTRTPDPLAMGMADPAAFPTGYATVSDNTPGALTAMHSDLIVAGAMGSAFAIERTWTVTDACGNAATPVVQTIEVQDLLPPTVDASGILSTVLDTGTACDIALPDFVGLGQVTATDACEPGGVTLVQMPAAGTLINLSASPLTVTFRATDPSGNMTDHPVMFTLVESGAPTAICQDITLPLDASGNALLDPAMVDNGSSDPCSAITLSVTPDTFTCADLGPQTVTLTVMDAFGNSDQCTATVTVVDLVGPTVVTQNLIIDLDAAGAATITAAAVDNGSFDACGAVTLAVSPDTFGCSDLGMNVVTLTVTDPEGNMATGNATITVRDVTPPTITYCPANFTIQVPSGLCKGTLDLSGANATVATDVCDPAPVITTDIPNGALLEPGLHTVVATATDASGNSTNCSFDVRVIADYEAPVSYAVAGAPVAMTSADLGDGVGAGATTTLEADGASDLIVVTDTGMVSILFNQGDGLFLDSGLGRMDIPVALGANEVLLDVAAGSFGAGAHTGLALLVHDTTSNLGRVVLLENTGTTLVALADVALTAENPMALVVADLNAAGSDDVVVALLGAVVGGGGAIEVIVDATAVTTTASALPLAGVQAKDLAVADLDRDGDPDVVFANSNAGTEELVLLENDGAGLLTRVDQVVFASESPTRIVAGDLDGDGDGDDLAVLTLGFPSGATLHTFLNGNLGSLSAAAFLANEAVVTAPQPRALAIGDVRHDTLRTTGAALGDAPLFAAQDLLIAHDLGAATAGQLDHHLAYDASLAGMATWPFGGAGTCETGAAPVDMLLTDLGGDPFAIDDLVIALAGDSAVSVHRGTGRALGTTFGVSCEGMGMPAAVAAASALPFEGETGTVHISGPPPGQLVTIAISGLADRIALPAGMTTCELYLGGSLFLLPPLPASAAGDLALTFPIPVGTLGQELFFQAAWFDPTSPLPNTALTTGLRVRVGR